MNNLFLKSNLLKKFDIRGVFVKYKKYNDKYIDRDTNYTREQLEKDFFNHKKEQLEKVKEQLEKAKEIAEIIRL